MAISKSEIWAAANALDAEGLRPTLQAVRKKLGSGSFTTISDAMSEWKSTKSADATKSREPLPTNMAERLSELGAEVWNAAVETAHARLDEERRDFAQKHEQMEARLAEAVGLADNLSQEIESLQSQVTELHSCKEQVARLTQQLADLERTGAEQLNRARERADQAEAAAAAERTAARDASDRAANAEGQLQAYKTQFAELTATVRSMSGPPSKSGS